MLSWIFCLTLMAPSADELVKRYDQAMGADAFEAVFAMVAHRDDGSTRDYKMRVLKLGSDKLRIWFDEPAAVRGQEMLRQGDNLWVYMPNLKRAVRIASRDSFQGGDFNNADVLRVNYAVDYSGAILEAESGGDAWVLELRAKTGDAAYERIKLWMDKKRLLPVKGEYYSNSGKMLRAAEFSDVKTFGNVTRPAHVLMKNMLAEKRFSEMTVEALNAKAKPTPTQFVIDNLGR